MASISGSSPTPPHRSSFASAGALTIAESRSLAISPQGGLPKEALRTQNSLKQVAINFFSGFRSPSSSSSLSTRSISPESAGSLSDGSASPVSVVSARSFSAPRMLTPSEKLAELKFSGSQGLFDHRNFGIYSDSDSDYVDRINLIFPKVGDDLRFNLEDFDAVTGSCSNHAFSPPLTSFHKMAKQMTYDLERLGSFTLFGKTFDNTHFSDRHDRDRCIEEIKTFIQQQLDTIGVTAESKPGLRIVNAMQQGIQTPLMGIANAVFNKPGEGPAEAKSSAAARGGAGAGAGAAAGGGGGGGVGTSSTGDLSTPSDLDVINALTGTPTKTLGAINWQKVKDAHFDINITKEGRQVRLETNLPIQLRTGDGLLEQRFNLKLVVADIDTGLSFVELKRIA